MPIHPLKRFEDKSRDFVMWLDYLAYAILNPFKFKPFPKKVERILVVELLKMGDLLVATPTIRALKEKFKDAQIDVLVLPEIKDLLKNNPFVNEVLIYASPKKTKEVISSKKYDLSIMLHPGSFKISWLLFCAKVKYRLGCTKAGIRYGKGFFLNKKLKPNLIWQHKIEDNLDVVRSINVDTNNKQIVLPIEEIAKKKISSLTKKFGKKLIGIHAPSLHRSQQWVPERFAEVADSLVKLHKCHIVFTGTDEDKDYINRIISMTEKKSNMVNLAGKTNLQEYIALIDRLSLLISVDTGALHIASAVSTPTVALFGPTIPVIWGPSYPKSRVIWKEKAACVGCRKYSCVFNKDFECMRSINVIDVLKQVGVLLR